jgi:hypothetical protein
MEWLITQATQTGYLPRMYKARLAVKESKEHAQCAAAAYEPASECLVQLSITRKVLLAGFMDGYISRAWRKGTPGLDIRDMPFSPGVRLQLLLPLP